MSVSSTPATYRAESSAKAEHPFREVPANISAATLRAELDTHGYALVRDLLPQQDALALLSKITAILSNAGWITTDGNPTERLADPTAACSNDDDEHKVIYDQVFALPSFHELPHHQALQDLMKKLVGPDLFVHPKSAGRLIFPHLPSGVIHAHQDHTALSIDSEVFTAWIPLHDCPPEQGTLRILDGSHKFGLQPALGDTGYLLPGSESGNHWVGGTIHAGDVLLFHSLTVHEAAPNLSNRLRISIDCRFQSYRQPVNPGVLVFAGDGRRSWENTYANWPAHPLRFYWKKFPLTFQPSRSGLAALAQSADSERMRKRYARTLQCLDEMYAQR